MTKDDTEALPIDYFASIGMGNRILKLLRDIPFEKARLGGVTENEIKRFLYDYTHDLIKKGLLKSTKSKKEEENSKDFRKKSERRGGRSVLEELQTLQESCQIEVRKESGEPSRYKLSNITLFYIHSLFPTTPSSRIVVESGIEPPLFRRHPSPAWQSKPLFDEIILVPGSLIFAGEHSALLGQPAVVLPIPLYVMVHATVYKYEKTTDVVYYQTFPSPYTLYGEMSTFPGTPVLSKDIHDSKFNEQIKNVVDLFKKKLMTLTKSSTDKSGYYVVLRFRSQIPPSVGLGSSGALSVALAILLDRIANYGDKNPLDYLNQRDLNSLFKEKESRLIEIFLNASEFERNIHGATSGVGPFASLFGDDCFTPLWYDLGVRPKDEEFSPKSTKKSADSSTCEMSRYLDRRKEGFTPTLNLSCRRGSDEAKRYLSKYLAVAAVYTTQSRPDLKSKQAEASYWKALNRPECRRDFIHITEKLWNNLCHIAKESEAEDDIQDVITCINLFGGYEEGYLKMLRLENEATARDLIYHMRGVGLGAKYIGSGFGGDIILVGQKEKVGTMLFPNYFPVHFHNVNLTTDKEETSPMEVRACPIIIDRDEFRAKLLPKFMDRAKRPYLD